MRFQAVLLEAPARRVEGKEWMALICALRDELCRRNRAGEPLSVDTATRVLMAVGARWWQPAAERAASSKLCRHTTQHPSPTTSCAPVQDRPTDP